MKKIIKPRVLISLLVAVITLPLADSFIVYAAQQTALKALSAQVANPALSQQKAIAKKVMTNPGISNELQKALNKVSNLNNPANQAMDDMNNLDKAMNSTYQALIKNVGDNIYPLIVATPSSDFKGVDLSLYLSDGKVITTHPVPQLFYQLKDIAHIPVAMFAILAPYFATPENTAWKQPLTLYDKKIITSINTIDNSTMPLKLKQLAKLGLTMTHKFITNALKTHKVSYADFQNYSEKFRPIIFLFLKQSTQAGQQGIHNVLIGWKQMLGQQQWDKMYAIVFSNWTMIKNNPTALALAAVMQPKLAKTHILVTSGVKNITQARAFLGSYIVNQALAAAVFGENMNLQGAGLIHNLTSQQALGAQDVEKVIEHYKKTGEWK